MITAQTQDLAQPFGQPSRLRRFLTALWTVRRRWWVALAVVIGSLFVFASFFTIGVNATDSLRAKVFIICKWQHSPKRGDLVAFRWHGGGQYSAGLSFVKYVGGVPGDLIEHRGREVLVDGHYIGLAKTHSRTGEPLVIGPQGVIPVGRIFVSAPHPDSLDSRYMVTGLIPMEAIIGRAIPLF